MINSKLIEILKSFSLIEIKNLSVFISKHAEKKDTLPLRLLIILEKQYPEFIEKKYLKRKNLQQGFF